MAYIRLFKPYSKTYIFFYNYKHCDKDINKFLNILMHEKPLNTNLKVSLYFFPILIQAISNDNKCYKTQLYSKTYTIYITFLSLFKLMYKQKEQLT